MDYQKIVNDIISVLSNSGYSIKDKNALPKTVKVKEYVDRNEIISVDELIESNRRDFVVIGLFARAKGMTEWNRDQRDAFIRRYVRAAKNLVGYKINDIMNTMAYLHKNANFKWTLETIGKYIDEDLARLEAKDTTNKSIKSL